MKLRYILKAAGIELINYAIFAVILFAVVYLLVNYPKTFAVVLLVVLFAVAGGRIAYDRAKELEREATRQQHAKEKELES